MKELNSDEIIKMSSQELFEYVEEQLEQNPVLEQGELDECTDEAILSLTDNAEDEEIEDEDDEKIEMITAEDMTIKEHLIAQLNTSSMDKKQKTVGEYIIDNIDENGYMLAGIEEIAAYFGFPEEYIGEVLNRLQSFDPPGVCARNLKECLTIQMKQLGTSNEDIKAVESFLDNVASDNIYTDFGKTGIESEKIKKLLEFVKTLEPKPAGDYYKNIEMKYVMPDIIIEKVKDSFQAIVHEDSIPAVHMNLYYWKISRDESLENDTKKFLKEKLDNASSLISNLNKRKDALKKLGDFILAKELEFLKSGQKHLKVLSFKDSAVELGTSEDRLRNIICNKYVQCCWGYFEAEYFFR